MNNKHRHYWQGQALAHHLNPSHSIRPSACPSIIHTASPQKPRVRVRERKKERERKEHDHPPLPSTMPRYPPSPITPKKRVQPGSVSPRGATGAMYQPRGIQQAKKRGGSLFRLLSQQIQQAEKMDGHCSLPLATPAQPRPQSPDHRQGSRHPKPLAPKKRSREEERKPKRPASCTKARNHADIPPMQMQ